MSPPTTLFVIDLIRIKHFRIFLLLRSENGSPLIKSENDYVEEISKWYLVVLMFLWYGIKCYVNKTSDRLYKVCYDIIYLK